MTRAPSTRVTGDSDGLTLVEVMVTVVLISLVAAVLAAVFSAVVRTTPATGDRVDDARSLLGLTNWLPQDVASTARSGFEQGPYTPRCTSIPPSSIDVLQLRWSEGSSTYVADYRYVRAGVVGEGEIQRFSCIEGQPAQKLKMTPTLQDLSGTTQDPVPVNLTLVPDGSGHRGVRFEVEVIDPESSLRRELISLDAFTTNIVTTLPPTTTIVGTTTTSPGNQAPVAADLTAVVTLDVPFPFTLPAFDADGDPLDVDTITPSGPELVVPVPGSGIDVTVTADSSAVPPATDGGTYSFDYRVTDGTDVSNVGTVTVIVDNSTPPGTTTTTTTTTTLACSASIDTVTPNPVARRINGRLEDDVVVTITTNGWCSPLVLSFDPDTTDANTTPQQIAFGSLTSVTIGKNDHVWNQPGSPPWTFALDLRAGATGPVLDTAGLTVN